jgi:pimeloyl-ACP methyl ester carboxylesterase
MNHRTIRRVTFWSGTVLLGWAMIGCSTSSGRPAEPATSATSGTVPSFDQVPISYELRGGGRTTLVFVHCWACDREFWREQLDVFARDYRVLALDLAGHGSSGANRTVWKIQDLAKDVQAVVEHLKLPRVILIGHSMGGPVALLAAARMPKRVVGVVGVDTLHNAEWRMPPEMVDGYAGEFEKDFGVAMSRAVETMFPWSTNETARTWVLNKAVLAHQQPAIGLIRDFPNLDLREAFAAVKVPVRCINAAPRGPGSLTTEVAINRKYADYGVVLMSGVGHYPQLERPEEFNEKLRAVLKEIVR